MNFDYSHLSQHGRFALAHVAQHRWFVFPVKAGTKAGMLIPLGLHAASDEPRRIAEWWERWPDANIGLNLWMSGLVAIDVDLNDPECEWADWVARHPLPDCLKQRTASGALHLIFRSAPDGVYHQHQRGVGRQRVQRVAR